jgi:OOP family OmpA-OmpF porin
MADETGLYGGINLGQSRANIDDKRITSELLGGGFATTNISDDDKDFGFKVFGGYQFNKNIAVEAGYFDLGEFSFRANTVPAGTLDGKIRIKGINLDLVGIIPFTDRFSAFGRVGVNYAEAKDSFSGTGAVNVTNPNPSERDTNYKFGLGVQYQLSDSLGVRAEAERYRINDAVGNHGDIDLFSVGLLYKFGTSTPAQPPPAMAPEPVAQAAPVVAAVAPPPPPEAPVEKAPPPHPPIITPIIVKKVTLSADSVFDFDSANVKAEGKTALDQLSRDLQNTDYDVIAVTGHTDRIGSHQYNQALSERRAAAVKSYLVETAGIRADKITATGTDGSNPVTKPEDCKGKKATKKLIACLQPDRRVEVEVVATQTSQ